MAGWQAFSNVIRSFNVNILNYDETDLLYHLLPATKMPDFMRETCQCGKNSKERVTVLYVAMQKMRKVTTNSG